MPNFIQTKIFTPISKAIRSHITRRVDDGIFDAKVMLGASIALDTTQNLVDYFQIGKNDKLDNREKKYLQAYKLTNAAVEGLLQLGVGALLINSKTQDFLIKTSQRRLGLPKNLSKTGKDNFRILSVLMGCVILAKRIIAPLIVTPLTAITRDYLCKKNEEKRYGQIKYLDYRG